MPYNPSKHHRRSIRLDGYDYSSPGFYFITCCINHRTNLLGEVIDGEMILNEAGSMVKNEWLALSTRFPNIALHEFIVMPNHFHGILEIVYRAGATTRVAPADALVGATLVVARNEKTEPIEKTEPDKLGQPQELPRPGIETADRNELGQPQELPRPGIETADRNEFGQPQGLPQRGIEPGNSGKAVKTLGDMIGAFISISTNEYIRGVKTSGWPRFEGKLWQRNYWEHIIRTQTSYQRISNYIKSNPKSWGVDTFKATK